MASGSQPFGTVTRLTLRSREAGDEAVAGLSELLEQVADRDGFLSGQLIRAGATALILVTTYASEEEAEAISAELRPRLSEVIGPLVQGPPDRAAGPLVASAD